MEREHILQLAQSLRWCAPQVHHVNPQISQVMRDAAEMLQMCLIKLNQTTSQPVHNVPNLRVYQEITQSVIQQLRLKSHHEAYDLALTHVQDQLAHICADPNNTPVP